MGRVDMVELDSAAILAAQSLNYNGLKARALDGKSIAR